MRAIFGIGRGKLWGRKAAGAGAVLQVHGSDNRQCPGNRWQWSIGNPQNETTMGHSTTPAQPGVTVVDITDLT
ncbi:MAG TPA: hypothetical protein VFX83_02735, partial [Azonexus sp.]|nr:hypothetical protein [Azonexus sp.]